MNLREATIAYTKTPKTTCEPIKSSRDAAAILRRLIPDAPQERFVVLGLDSKNRAVTWTTIGVGTLTCCPVDATATLRFMVLAGCASFVLSHNHPSGDPMASAEDVALTERLRQGAKLLDVKILDHIILGFESDYFSFLDAGLLGR